MIRKEVNITYFLIIVMVFLGIFGLVFLKGSLTGFAVFDKGVYGISGVNFFKEDFDPGSTNFTEKGSQGSGDNIRSDEPLEESSEFNENQKIFNEESSSPDSENGEEIFEGFTEKEINQHSRKEIKKIFDKKGNLDIKKTGGSFFSLGDKLISEDTQTGELARRGVSVETTRSKIVIDRPVKWIKKINIDQSKKSLKEEFSVFLDKDVKNISILTGRDALMAERDLNEHKQILEEISREKIKSGKITGNVAADVNFERGIIGKFFESIADFVSEGDTLDENELEKKEQLKKGGSLKKINLTELFHKEDEIIVEYYTSSPESFEKRVNYGKMINVSSRGEMGYEDILAYTDFVKGIEKDNLEFYHLENGAKKKEDFRDYDLDDDGKVDYIEWDVSHLSSQIYGVVTDSSKLGDEKINAVKSNDDSDKDGFYDISNCIELQGILLDLNENYELVKDIDCKGFSYDFTENNGFMPIGNSSKGFSGILKGNDYMIENLRMKRPLRENVAVFGFLNKKAIIEDLGLINFNISGGEKVSSIVSFNEGSIKDCYSKGEVYSITSKAGGFVYENEGDIFNCYSFVDLFILKGELPSNIKGFVGKGVVSGVNNLEIEGIPGIFFSSEKSASVEINIRNTGSNFLNDCRFEMPEGYSMWISESERKSIASGQRIDYEFNIDVPKNKSAGKYKLPLNFKCQELKKEFNLPIEIIEKDFVFEFINAYRFEDKINLSYSIKELSGEKQKIDVDFKFIDSDKDTVADINKKIEIEPRSFNELGVAVPVKKSLEGELKLFVNMNSESYSSFFQESILINKPAKVSGFSVLDKVGGADSLATLLMVALFGGFAFLVLKRIKKNKKSNRISKKEYRKKLFKEFDSGSGGVSDYFS